MKRIEQPLAADPTLLLDERPATEELDEERRTESREDEADTEYETLEERAEGELPVADELPPGELDAEDEDAHAPDDALGLYLRQMGAIPLLNRDQELALAMQLEMRRRRYRLAALSSWRTIASVVDTFERVQKQELALDPTIDVVNTLGLTRENILKRMPHHLPLLRHLVKGADAGFRDLLKATTATARGRIRRDLWRKLSKARRLAEELSRGST